MRKGSEWWGEALWVVVAEKMHANEVWLQRKDGVSFERYKDIKNLARRVVPVAKVSVDER